MFVACRWYYGVMKFDHLPPLQIVKETFNPRNVRLEPFVTRINNSRVAAGYKPYSESFIASKMSHIETDDLVGFYKKLDESKSFGGLWHYYCMPKKKT